MFSLNKTENGLFKVNIQQALKSKVNGTAAAAAATYCLLAVVFSSWWTSLLTIFKIMIWNVSM